MKIYLPVVLEYTYSDTNIFVLVVGLRYPLMDEQDNIAVLNVHPFHPKGITLYLLTVNGQTGQHCPIKCTPLLSKRGNTVMHWALNLNSVQADSRNLAFKSPYVRGYIVLLGDGAYFWSPTHLVVLVYHVIDRCK
jgi:hypothetical protein